MAWYVYLSLSILLYSFNSLLNRTLMKEESSSPYAQATIFPALVSVYSFIILMFRGGFKSHITLETLPLFLLLTVVTALGMIFTFKGIKLVEASKHTILITSSRIWVIIGAIVFLKETITINMLIGNCSNSNRGNYNRVEKTEDLF